MYHLFIYVQSTNFIDTFKNLVVHETTKKF